MAFLKERRLHERYDHEADIIYSCEENPEFNNARLFNSSKGGMYFNSKHKLYYGSLVSIKMNRFCSVFYANVTRCEKIKDNGNPCYGIGIKFFSLEE